MSQYHTVKVDGALYVPLSHWETVVADRDKWKKLYEELEKAGEALADGVRTGKWDDALDAWTEVRGD